MHGKSSLAHASEEGYEFGMRMLLGAGAAVDAKNNEGKTPLMWVIINKHEGAVRVLLEAGGGSGFERQRRNDGTDVRQQERVRGCGASAAGGRGVQRKGAAGETRGGGSKGVG